MLDRYPRVAVLRVVRNRKQRGASMEGICAYLTHLSRTWRYNPGMIVFLALLLGREMKAAGMIERNRPNRVQAFSIRVAGSRI